MTCVAEGVKWAVFYVSLARPRGDERFDTSDGQVMTYLIYLSTVLDTSSSSHLPLWEIIVLDLHALVQIQRGKARARLCRLCASRPATSSTGIDNMHTSKYTMYIYKTGNTYICLSIISCRSATLLLQLQPRFGGNALKFY